MNQFLFKNEISFGLLPFETIYFDQKEPHFLLEHYNRLKRAHNVLKIKFELRFEDFKNKIVDEISRIGKKCGVLKVIYIRDNIYTQFREFTYTQKQYDDGVKLRKSKTIRDSKNILNYLKTFNYGLNFIEDKRAKENGFDSALFLNQNGFVCETSYANIFFVKGEKIFTPHVSCGILRGIMREQIINYLKGNGFKIEKGFIRYDELDKFDECFLSNSVMGVLSVNNIDDISFENKSVFKKISKEEIFLRNWID